MGWVRLDAAVTDLDAVEEQGDVAALGESAAVVGEFHADLVLALRDRVVGPVTNSAHAEKL